VVAKAVLFELEIVYVIEFHVKFSDLIWIFY